tara:strand:- start:2883 stop:3197 length:315 start_codon:yes stop_codon:yes gene_type:complete
MVLATGGWGTWWLWVALTKWAPGLAPPLVVVYALTCGMATVGAALAFFTIRARKAWILLAAVPFLANLSLASIPLLFGDEVRAWQQEAADRHAADELDDASTQP